MTRDEILLAAKEHLFPAVIHFFDEPLIIDHAKDQFVFDVDGNRYLDFFGGIVTVSVGHCNEKVVEAIQQQAGKLLHVSTLYRTEPQVALAKRLAEVAPGRLTKSFFTNSGSEANETAIALARIHTGNTEIVALRHGYHGRTEAGLRATGQSIWRGPLPPQQGGFVHAHAAYCYRCPFGLEYPSCDVRCARDAKELIETTTSGRVAGLIAEPIQGSGGFITPPKEYFQIVVDIVREHGGIFIADEVQTGWGRTGGKWFGIEQYGVTPEVMTFAKGLGDGMPIGVTLATGEVADSMRYLTLSTFGGNPVSTAAAKAVIDYIEEENLLANCSDVGGYLRDGLEAAKQKYPLIGDVRGMGLMQALELVTDRESKRPAPEQASGLLDASRRNGLLIGKGGLYGNVIRISPPMNISRGDVDEFLRLLDASLIEVGAQQVARA